MNDKNARIELRVTQSEKNKIAKLSESCGLSQSEYVRQRTLGYSPRTVQPDVFFDFYQTLCRLCDEVADKVSPDTERRLIEAVDEIQRQLLLPEKSTTAQIRKEIQSGAPRSLLRGEKEHPRSDNPVDDLSATDMSGV